MKVSLKSVVHTTFNDWSWRYNNIYSYNKLQNIFNYLARNIEKYQDAGVVEVDVLGICQCHRSTGQGT